MPSRKAKKAGTLWDLKRLGDQTRHFPTLGILPEAVRADYLGQSCPARRHLDGLVHHGQVHVMAPHHAAERVRGHLPCRKHRPE